MVFPRRGQSGDRARFGSNGTRVSTSFILCVFMNSGSDDGERVQETAATDREGPGRVQPSTTEVKLSGPLLFKE